MRICSVACMLLLAVSSVAFADDDKCTPELKTYYKPDKLPDKVTSRCEVKDGKCVSVELKGYLYLPPKPKLKKAAKMIAAGSASAKLVGAPLILFNHGSEKLPMKKCSIGMYFAKLGFVVFMPYRFGQGKSTGAIEEEFIKSFCSTPGQGAACKMEYLHEQVKDVEQAIDYVKGLKDANGKPLVNSERIIIGGHSFGGIVSVFANTKDLGQKAVFDASGASHTWSAESTRKDLKAAVKDAVAPIYFFAPMNDHSIDSTIELSRTAGLNCRQYQVTLFPAEDADGDGKITKLDYASDWDKDGDDSDPRNKAHGTYMEKNDVWGPSLMEFINRSFEHPAQPFDTLCKGTSSQP